MRQAQEGAMATPRFPSMRREVRRSWLVALAAVAVVAVLVGSLLGRAAWHDHVESQWLPRLHEALTVVPVPSPTHSEVSGYTDWKRVEHPDEGPARDWHSCRMYSVQGDPFVAADVALQAYLDRGYTVTGDERHPDGYVITVRSPDGTVTVSLLPPMGERGPTLSGMVACADPTRAVAKL
jgi:hypothetical protein